MSDNLPWETPPPPRKPRRPSHDDILQSIRLDTYVAVSLRECGVWDKPFKNWTSEERRAVAKRQADMRAELGIPEPQT